MWLNEDCFAALGVVSNINNSDFRIPKAGVVRN
jgi:ribosomal protein L2